MTWRGGFVSRARVARRLPHSRVVLAVLLGAVLAGACGKRGNPLPPLRPTPGRIADLTVHRIDDRVELRLTIPGANQDGTTPAAVTRVDIFAMPGAAGAPAPAASQLADDPRNLRRSIAVRPAPETETTNPPPNAPPDVRPRPGDAATFVDRPLAGAAAGAPAPAIIYYVARGVAGNGRGRPGPWSPVVAVPIAALPAAPHEPVATNDETTTKITWQPGAEGQTFLVFAPPAAGAAREPEVLTPTPLATPSFSVPAEFGKEQCFLVRAVQVSGAVTVESAPVGPVCHTPKDTFPPAPPAGLQAVQEGASVTLLWNPVDAPDMAGYLVLRRESTATVFQQLTPAPITAAAFTDAAPKAGTTYIYAVVAVDTSGNLSPQSNWQTVTVR